MNRLEAIKSMVPKCEVVADIGTDHGYVAEMLLSDNTANKVIATDLNSGPLNRAIEYLTSRNREEQCDFRLGSGLTVLHECEADCIIIAGMGGDLIRDILDISKNVSIRTKQLVLQPMTAIDKLRKYLVENKYIIEDELIVKELHHYYFIIKVNPPRGETNNKTVEEKDEIFYEISKPLLEKRDKVMFEYLDKVIFTNNSIINNLNKQMNLNYNDKIESLKLKNNKIMELKKKYAIL